MSDSNFLTAQKSSISHIQYLTFNISHSISHIQYLQYLIQYLTFNISHSISHIQYLTFNISHSISHIQYLTFNISHSISHIQYLTFNISHRRQSWYTPYTKVGHFKTFVTTQSFMQIASCYPTIAIYMKP